MVLSLTMQCSQYRVSSPRVPRQSEGRLQPPLQCSGSWERHRQGMEVSLMDGTEVMMEGEWGLARVLCVVECGWRGGSAGL